MRLLIDLSKQRLLYFHNQSNEMDANEMAKKNNILVKNWYVC